MATQGTSFESMSQKGTTAASRVPVAAADGVWLQDSPRNRMIINSVVTLDRISLEEIRKLWQERVVDLEGGQRYPRFTLKVVKVGGRNHWEEAEHYDVARHIVPAPANVRTVEELQDYVSSLAETPLPDDRPLWQIQHIENFEDGSSAFITRIHHCMGDGLALVPVLFSVMDASQEGLSLPGDRVAKRRHSKLALAATLPVFGPWVLAQKLAWRADRSQVHGAELSGTKRVAWTRKFPVAQIKTVKNCFDATVNDVLMATVAGAFHRYLGDTEGIVPDRIRASMPVSVRAVGEAPQMNNRFAAVLLELPSGLKDVRARVAETKRRMDAVKRSVEPLVTYGLASLMLRTMPQGISGRLIDFLANKCTCVVTNVPGPQEDLYIGGRKLRSMIFWVPQRAKIGIGISIFSFAGHVQVGVISDTKLLPDPRAFVRSFEAELDHMIETAGAA